METRIRIAEPFGSDFRTVPNFLSAQPVWPFRDKATMTLHYPEAGVNSSLLNNECEAVFEYWNGSQWVEPLDSRYKLDGGDRDKLEAIPTRRLNFVSLIPALLESAYVWEDAGLPTDTDGNILFAAATPGIVLRTLFLNAQARGWAPGLSVDFTDSHDSDGKPWAGAINLALDPAQTLYEVLSALGSQGIIDWAGQGRTLRVFNPNTFLGRSLPNVRLLASKGETSAPEQVSHRDRATVLRVVGEGGQRWDRSNGTSPWGRQESIMSAGGVSDEGTAYLMSDEELLKASGARISRTREFNEASDVLPHRDFRGGDHVMYQTDNKLEPMRVFSMSLTIDRGLSGHVVLGDRFEDKLIEAARKQQRLVVGKVNGGNGQQPTQPTDDVRTPSAPFGFIGASAVYMDPTGAEVGIITASWSHTGKATDGTAMNLDRFEFMIRDSFPGAPWRSFLGVPGEERTASFSPVDTRREDGEAAMYDLRIRAVGANSRPSGWVQYTQILMELDTVPPPVPSALTIENIQYAVATARWDGLGAGNEPMPPDFDYTEGEVGESPLGPWQVFGRFEKASSQTIPFDLPYGTYWLRARSFDLAGNASEYSELTEFELESFVNIPDVHDKINELETGISNAVDSANGKNRVHHQLYPPNVDGETVGDTWFQFTFSNRLIGQWQWDGTQWVQQTLSHEIISSVDLGTATVGFLHGSRIEAKTLSIQTLIAGDFTNLAQVDAAWGTNVTIPASCETVAVDGWTRKAPGGDNILLFMDQAGPVPVESGDEIYVSFVGVSDVPTTVSCSLWVYPSKDAPFGALSDTRTAISFSDQQDYGFTLTVPDLSGIDGGNSWTVGLAGAGIRYIGVQNVRIYKKTGAVLIQDGAIHASHIGAEEIEAEHIKSNSITGDRMAAGFADFIVMTGSLIQTMATPMYGIKIDGGTNSMRAWNITNDLVFHLNGDNGNLVLGKDTMIQLSGSTGNLDIGNGRFTVDGATGDMVIGRNQTFRVAGNNGSLNIGNGKLTINGATGDLTMLEGHLQAGRVTGSIVEGGRVTMVGTGPSSGYYVNISQGPDGGYIAFGTPAGNPNVEDGASGTIRTDASTDTNRVGVVRLGMRSPATIAYPERGRLWVEAWGVSSGPGNQPRVSTDGDFYFTRGAEIYGATTLTVDTAGTLDLGVDASVRSLAIRDRPYTSAANVFVTSEGYIGQTSSASRFKLDQRVTVLDDALLDVPVKDWIDRTSHEEIVELQALGVRTQHQQKVLESDYGQRRVPGVVAEDVAAVTGGALFVTYDLNGREQGVAYDRLAIAQIAVLTRRVKALEALLIRKG